MEALWALEDLKATSSLRTVRIAAQSRQRMHDIPPLLRFNVALSCRFSLQLEVGMPNAKQREAILKLYLDRQVDILSLWRKFIYLQSAYLLLFFKCPHDNVCIFHSL